MIVKNIEPVARMLARYYGGSMEEMKNKIFEDGIKSINSDCEFLGIHGWKIPDYLRRTKK